MSFQEKKMHLVDPVLFYSDPVFLYLIFRNILVSLLDDQIINREVTLIE